MAFEGIRGRHVVACLGAALGVFGGAAPARAQVPPFVLVAQPESQAGAPLAPADPIQENGDWERHPYAPHIPIGLGPLVPFGALDGRAGGLADNAGVVTSFELGVGVRVRRVLVELVFAIGGAGGGGGPTQQAIARLGYEPGGVLRVFAGVDAAYYLLRTETWAPWVGGRFGYQSLVFNGSRGSDRHVGYDYSGMYLAARTGIDWRVAPAFGLGPYLELGLGTALGATARESVDDNPLTLANESRSSEGDVTVEGPAFHGFIGGGVRAVFFP